MKNLINKVISGNANKAEIDALNNWLKASEVNQKTYDQELLIWNLLGSTKKSEPEVDMNKAWEKFEAKLQNQKINKSRLLYKIAAILIIVISIGSVGSYLLFENPNSTIASYTKKIIPTSKKYNKVFKTTPLDTNQTVVDKKFIISKKKTKIKKQEEFVTEIVLVDSSVVTLSDNSALNFLEKNHNTSRIATLVGAGVFDIKPSSQLFVLETEHIIIHVDGTKFNISDPEDNYRFVEISVEEGTMDVFDKSNFTNSISLTAGQKYLFDIDKKLFVKINTKKKKKSFWNFFKKN